MLTFSAADTVQAAQLTLTAILSHVSCGDLPAAASILRSRQQVNARFDLSLNPRRGKIALSMSSGSPAKFCNDE
uniref:Uncharacterized protein n=1 Tax=Pristionchus pacificus TaxID=54126 RepID=A0A2A6BI00_PRIPA|eukprot:PDM65456.1 hypothetical protein PRIPAC_52398 [Pristionchus pacificus]